jgi:hypothetical protein
MAGVPMPQLPAHASSKDRADRLVVVQELLPGPSASASIGGAASAW